MRHSLEQISTEEIVKDIALSRLDEMFSGYGDRDKIAKILEYVESSKDSREMVLKILDSLRTISGERTASTYRICNRVLDSVCLCMLGRLNAELKKSVVQ